jgi:hypothetical protein
MLGAAPSHFNYPRDTLLSGAVIIVDMTQQETESVTQQDVRFTKADFEKALGKVARRLTKPKGETESS